MQPKKHSEDYSNHSTDSKDGQPAPKASEALVAQTEVQKLLKHPMNIFRSIRRLQDSTTKSSGLVRPGTVGLFTGAEYSRVGSNTWIRPTSFVSTRIGVELVDALGNKPNLSD